MGASFLNITDPASIPFQHIGLIWQSIEHQQRGTIKHRVRTGVVWNELRLQSNIFLRGLVSFKSDSGHIKSLVPHSQTPYP